MNKLPLFTALFVHLPCIKLLRALHCYQLKALEEVLEWIFGVYDEILQNLWPNHHSFLRESKLKFKLFNALLVLVFLFSEIDRTSSIEKIAPREGNNMRLHNAVAIAILRLIKLNVDVLRARVC